MTKYPSLYDELKDNDIIQPLLNLLRGPGFKLRQSDGKFVPTETSIVYDGPWDHIRTSYIHRCGIWHSIIFGLVGWEMRKQRFVPSYCQACFKVVVKPKTLEGLFALRDMQVQMDYQSKCGIEPRPTVHGLYGGYFYNRGLEEGLEKYRIVRDAVNENKVLGPALLPENSSKPGTVVLLKRACTEMEVPPPDGCGPSDKWVTTPWQMHKEHLIEIYTGFDEIHAVFPKHIKKRVWKRWIEPHSQWNRRPHS